MKEIIYSNKIMTEDDVVLSRKVARKLSSMVGLDNQDQARVATAVSEITRDVLKHSEKGEISFYIEGGYSSLKLLCRLLYTGRKIEDSLESDINNEKKSSGILIAKKLIDFFEINKPLEEETEIILGKKISRGLSKTEIDEISVRLKKTVLNNPYNELQQQNKELSDALMEIKESRAKLISLNKELSETNKGMVALYTELDEKAEQLRSALDTKSKFFSYMSHELKTPIISIISLARLLLNKTDGNLTSEQEKQVNFILNSSNELIETINNFLDIIRAESGNFQVKADWFDPVEFLSTLKGLLRPLNSNKDVSLEIKEPENIPRIYSDKGKIYQIARNLVSNALKFTKKGKVSICLEYNSDTKMLSLIVSDTGIGISNKDIGKVFDEYYRVEDPDSGDVEGSGLGLPLSLKLAKILGGEITVKSKINKGSTFCLKIPAIYKEELKEPKSGEKEKINGKKLEDAKLSKKILIVDDSKGDRYLIKKFLQSTPYNLLEAGNGEEGANMANETIPDLILLDLIMPKKDGLEVLDELRQSEETKNIPVIIITSKVLDEEESKKIDIKANGIINKENLSSETIIKEIARLL